MAKFIPGRSKFALSIAVAAIGVIIIFVEISRRAESASSEINGGASKSASNTNSSPSGDEELKNLNVQPSENEAHFSQSRAFYALVHDELEFPTEITGLLSERYREKKDNAKLLALLYLTEDQALRAQLQKSNPGVEGLKALALTAPSVDERLRLASELLQLDPDNPEFKLIKASAQFEAGNNNSAVELLGELVNQPETELNDSEIVNATQEVWRDAGESMSGSKLLSRSSGYTKELHEVVNLVVSESSFHIAEKLSDDPHGKARLAGNVIQLLKNYSGDSHRISSFGQAGRTVKAELQILENLPYEMDYDGQNTVEERVSSLLGKKENLQRLRQFVGTTLVSTDDQLASAFADSASKHGVIYAARSILGAPEYLVDNLD